MNFTALETAAGHAGSPCGAASVGRFFRATSWAERRDPKGV